MVYKKFTSKSTQETKRLGFCWAEKVKKGGVLALYGELGAGKTTFVQGIASGLKIKQTVNSPSFIVVNRYGVNNRQFFYHIDLYRIDNEEEIEELGIKEILADKKNIVAIEWPEELEKWLPKNTIKIYFRNKEKNKREIVF